jgi:hypothetical protein
VWRDEDRTLVAPPKASLRQDPGMVHSGECTPGCTCYQKIEHCREWDPMCAPRCRCRFHLEAAETSWSYSDALCDGAWDYAWGEPPQPGSMEGSVCVLSGTKKCSCTPGGPGGCYPDPSG